MPKSINLSYSLQYKEFYTKYKDEINFIEIEQDSRAIDIYNTKPGEDRCRWNIESIFYNQKLYEYLYNKNKVYDVLLSYYNLDGVFMPKNIVKKNVLYLCGNPKLKDDYQGSFLYVYDKVLAISEKVKNYWQVYRKENIEVVPTGVDFERFAPKQWSNSDRKIIKLLYVGRLITRKNVDKIISAFEMLRKKFLISLMIVGDGPDRDRLEKISKDVVFIGAVLNTEDYYRDADIFISPSEYGEGLQGSILEAMSCGLTVVATNTDINNKLLSNNRGILVEPNIECIVAGIEKAILLDRNKIAIHARKYVIDNYNWKDKVALLQEKIK